jgi:hypothetical protein
MNKKILVFAAVILVLFFVARKINSYDPQKIADERKETIEKEAAERKRRKFVSDSIEAIKTHGNLEKASAIKTIANSLSNSLVGSGAYRGNALFSEDGIVELSTKDAKGNKLTYKFSIASTIVQFETTGVYIRCGYGYCLSTETSMNGVATKGKDNNLRICPMDNTIYNLLKNYQELVEKQN